jgi:hypothetical protein
MVADLRPRGIGEILDAAVSLYRARFARLLLLAAIVVVPVQVVSTLVLLSAQPDSFSPNLTGSTTPQFSGQSPSLQLGALAIVLIITVLSNAFIVALSTRVVADAYTDQGEATTAAARVVSRRFFAIVGAATIVALSQAVGVVACGVGYVLVWVFFAVTVPALILEGARVFTALGRSAALTRSHFFRVLGLLVMAQLLTVVLSFSFAVAINIWLNHGASVNAAIVAQGIANTVAQCLTIPFTATAIVVMYFDLRIRSEGFDVQLTMQRNDARHAAIQASAVRTAS